jgi:nitrogen-specific signal transduction histidine kinase/CheY-like chemotaxis protein
LNTVFITWEGRAATLNFLRDITEQKALEDQFQQAQKMEAIGTLAGGIAHDFNNLLMGVQGRTSLMLVDADTSQPHHEHLKGIEGYVKSATELTRQLLGFARGGKYEVVPTNLNELVKNSSDMFGRTQKEITIYPKYQKDIWVVDVDQGQIEQVLLNLYVNAWQAMAGGGKLFLKTENVTLDEFLAEAYGVDPGRYVKISVTDTGMGMDKKTQQRIFDPFFTTKEMGRGTGLGLASAYGILKNHRGIIHVYSELGQGTTFNIYLPVSEKTLKKKKDTTTGVIGGTEGILLVDDEELVIGVGSQMLEKLGYRVQVATDGQEAINIYEANQEAIQLIILDMVLPGMGGGQIYDKLKKVNPKVKVLLSSGYTLDGIAAEILNRGCNGFIQKPFNLKQLSLKIRSIIDNTPESN